MEISQKKNKNNDDVVSFIFFSSKRAQPRKINIPTLWAKRGLYFFASLCFLLTIIGFHYVSLLKASHNFKKTQIQNQLLARHIGNLEGKMSSIDQIIKQINEFSIKLSTMAGTPLAKTVALKTTPKPPNEELESETPVPQEWSQESYFDELSAKLDTQKETLALEQLSLEETLAILTDQTSLLAGTPSLKPARGWITSGFGPRISPWNGQPQIHEGVDIAARPGTQIIAPADGIVTFAGLMTEFGKALVIDHGYRTITRYGHTSAIYVTPGQKVKRGDVIASVGSTGRATGPHLHYEVIKDGKPIDPLNYILD